MMLHSGHRDLLAGPKEAVHTIDSKANMVLTDMTMKCTSVWQHESV